MMRKVAIYPGSFNPWHEGHTDVLEKALRMFDKVVIVRCINPMKSDTIDTRALVDAVLPLIIKHKGEDRIEVQWTEGLLKDFVAKYPDAVVVVRGLRNNADFEYEKIQQYWQEDLGMLVPYVYFISDRALVHKSSSIERAVSAFKEGLDKKPSTS